jgi:hypothetical protein
MKDNSIAHQERCMPRIGAASFPIRRARCDSAGISAKCFLKRQKFLLGIGIIELFENAKQRLQGFRRWGRDFDTYYAIVVGIVYDQSVRRLLRTGDFVALTALKRKISRHNLAVPACKA